MSQPLEDTVNSAEERQNGTLQPTSTLWTPPVCQSEPNPANLSHPYYEASEPILPATIDYSGNQYPMPPPLLSPSSSVEDYQGTKLSHSFLLPSHLPPLDSMRYLPPPTLPPPTHGLHDCPSPRSFLNLSNPPDLNLSNLPYSQPLPPPQTAQSNGNDHSDEGDYAVDGDSSCCGKVPFMVSVRLLCLPSITSALSWPITLWLSYFNANYNSKLVPLFTLALSINVGVCLKNQLCNTFDTLKHQLKP